MSEGSVCHAFDDVALAVGDGVDGAEVVVVEVAGFVEDGGCVYCGFNVDGNELAVGVDEVFVFGVGVLFDLFVEFADVGGGNGGVAAGEAFGFVEGGPLDEFVVVLGHVVVGVVEVIV
ncbi:hypothetical protein THERMOT_2068 [Bathymodiolus thermophilus thioautotrophic gill symbiont]|nr:hypothetical protein THERMOT_2068 [Bathymodiolus thermophilus thioautotrophic gill symbiont]